jgi:hypothetical protein
MTTHETTAAEAAPESFAEIRRSLVEFRASLREISARRDDDHARDHARAMRKLAEISRQQEETARQMKETDRRLRKAEGLFTSDWGLLMESLVRGDLVALLRERGVHVNHTQSGRFRGRRNGEHFEVDILAENGREVVVVEVKTTLRPPHVRNFVSRLSEFEEWFPVYRGKRVLGGMAYLQCDPSLRKHAERQGLFVIRATGSSASIVNAPDFKPRVFS